MACGLMGLRAWGLRVSGPEGSRAWGLRALGLDVL